MITGCVHGLGELNLGQGSIYHLTPISHQSNVDRE